jgi:hypothetical protein
MISAHTCKSCSHYRLTGCALGLAGWPVMALAHCPSAVWEPGADEAEDWT